MAEGLPDSITVTINNVNEAPELAPISDIVLDEGGTVTLTPTATDIDQDALSFTYSGWMSESAKTTTFEDAGIYTVTVTVSDGLLNDSQQVNITVNDVNRAPVMDSIAPITVFEGESVSLTLQISDPDGDLLTLTYSGWMNSSMYTTGFDDSGVYTVTATITDGYLQASQIATITVLNTNRPPVAGPGTNQTVDEGADILLTGAASFDPDNDPFTYSWVQLSGIPVTLSDSTLSSPAFTAPDISNDTELLTFQLTVHDGTVTSAPQTVSITVNDVLKGPEITGITPEAGAIGTTVTITGLNFNAGLIQDLKVFFGDIPSTILSITETAIITSVPLGTVSAPLTVVTTHGSIASATSFSVTEIIPDLVPPTVYFKGEVFDAKTELPIPGALVFAEHSMEKIETDTNGTFTYSMMHGGKHLIFIEKPGYITAKRAKYIESERTFQMGRIYLTPNDPKVTLISALEGGTATDSTGTVEVIFPPGALGADIEFTATRFTSTKGYPVPIPEGQVFVDSIQFDPEVIGFNEPVTVRISNKHGFAPGTKLPFGFGMHHEHDPFPELSYYDPGMAEVSADGEWIVFTTDHFSCPSFILPPGPPTGSGSPINSSNPFEQASNHQYETGKNLGAAINRSTGNLKLGYSTVPYRAMGAWNNTTLVYNTSTAQPGSTVTVNIDNSALAAKPLETSLKINLEGLSEEITFVPVGGEARMAFYTGGEESILNTLRSGTYYPELTITNTYQANFFTSDTFGGPPVSDTGVQSPEPVPLSTKLKGAININNQQTSPVGWGWGIKGVKKLIENSDGTVLIVDGDGSSSQFRPGHLPGETAVESIPGAFVSPTGIVYNPEGDIFVTDKGANTVFIIPAGTSTPAALATISKPTGIVYHPDQFLYVASEDQAKIYKVHMDGTVEVFVTLPAYSPNLVQDIALDSQNNLYVYDTGGTVNVAGSHALYKISPAGFITTLLTGQNTLLVSSMAVDPDDTLYLSFNNAGFLSCSASFIAKYTEEGGLSTFAANLNSPAGMTFDSDGMLYVIDRNCASQEYHLYKIDPAGFKTVILEDELGTDPAQALTLFNHGLTIAPNGGITVASTSLQEILVEKGFDYLAPPHGEFGILTRNPDNSHTLTSKNKTVTNYDAFGLMTEQIDRNGNKIEYTYSPGERLLAITDQVGGITRFSYNASGLLEYITDPANRSTRITHNSEGNITAITNPDSSSTAYTYDTSHLLTSKTTPGNGVYSYYYNTYGRVDLVESPEGGVTAISPGELQDIVNDLTPNSGPSTTLTQESIADILIDANGALNINKTDSDGALQKIIDALGLITSFERNIHHHPVKITAPNDAITSMGYDLWGNLLRATKNDFATTASYTYDPIFNQVTSVTDPKGNKTAMEYDSTGNLLTTTDALGNTTTNTYNQRGQILTTTNALSQTTTMTYYQNGNILTTTDPLGNTTNNTYDLAGNLISTTDAENNTTFYEYDVMNKLIKVRDSLNNETSYTYQPGMLDTKPLLASITDAKENITTMNYDKLDRLINTTNPGNLVKSYTYDQNNNMISSTDPNGQTIHYEYDDLNRLIKKLLPDDTVYYEYDSMGNILQVGDFDSHVAMEYDQQSRLTKSEGTVHLAGEKTFSGDTFLDSANYIYENKNIIVDGATLTLNGKHTFKNLTLKNGGKLTSTKTNTLNTSVLDITVTEILTVDITSSIDVTGIGYAGANQSGNSSQIGMTIGNTTIGGSTGDSGGSYGGSGGDSNGQANTNYGNLYTPNSPGSGGGTANSIFRAGSGGGFVRISANTIKLDGAIKSDGANQSNYFSGGGSGGNGIHLSMHNNINSL